MQTEDVPPYLLDRARRLAEQGTRRILGITGAPGAGKSTLAASVVAALGERAACVPMDGFHLANAELRRLGRQERKGAPDTFDPGGYAALLRRLREPDEPIVYAPAFDRALEEPIGSAIPVGHEVRLVVTEGNYLLADTAGWSAVSGFIDEAWFLEVPEEVRIARLVERHRAFGKSPADAELWARGSDQRNADAVVATRARADLVVAGDLR